jgi:hypothetical protein
LNSADGSRRRRSWAASIPDAGDARIPVVALETTFPEGNTIYAGRFPVYSSAPEPGCIRSVLRDPCAGEGEPAVFDGHPPTLLPAVALK